MRRRSFHEEDFEYDDIDDENRSRIRHFKKNRDLDRKKDRNYDRENYYNDDFDFDDPR